MQPVCGTGWEKNALGSSDYLSPGVSNNFNQLRLLQTQSKCIGREREGMNRHEEGPAVGSSRYRKAVSLCSWLMTTFVIR